MIYQLSAKKNCIGVSLPELIQYIFDEVEPTHLRFPHITANFLPNFRNRNRMLFRIFMAPQTYNMFLNLSFKSPGVQYLYFY